MVDILGASDGFARWDIAEKRVALANVQLIRSQSVNNLLLLVVREFGC